MSELSLWVNGEHIETVAAPGEMLSDVLRYRLGLTGTKIACNEDECGACTVLLAGMPVFSCTFPAMKAAGKHITTIEGLAQGDHLHPLQEAFAKYGALQCGFCTPGLLMTAYALLQENPNPTVAEIKDALKITLCRCGSYSAVIRAIQAAARSLASEGPVEAPELPTPSLTKVVGHHAIRPDAIDKVIGAAKFADDYDFPGMLHARVLRAGVPHAVVKRIDVAKAREIEGVRAVLTANDLPAARLHGNIILDWPVLVGVGEKVRYVGDAIALVAADSRAIAGEAMEAIEVTFEALPVVSDPVKALEENAPPVHETGNLLKLIEVGKGDLQAAVQGADPSLEDTYHTPIYEHAFMEPECSIARPMDDGRMEIYVGSQIPYEDRYHVAASLGVELEEVRVIGTLIGGAFGGKEDIAGQIHAALLAQTTGRPVKLLFDRHESLLVHPKRHATQIQVRLWAKQDGELAAAQTKLHGDTGAYASYGVPVMTRASTHSTGPYVIPNVEVECHAVYTNNPPAGACRGFGVLQSAFAIESAMDQLAERLGIDPVDLRRRNALREGTVTNTGQLLKESAGLVECIDRAEEKMYQLCDGRDPFQPQAVEGSPHLSRAWGFAVAFKNTGLGCGLPDKAGAEVELNEAGELEVRSSSAELGQGLPTVLQMIAAEEIGLPLERVRVLLSDTDLTPDGGPTTASRQTYITGNAVKHATLALQQAMTAILSEKHDAPPSTIRFEEGSAWVGDENISFDQIAATMRSEGREPRAFYEYTPPQTLPLGQGGDAHIAYGFAAYAAEVEVNLATGEVRVLRVIAACDVGKAINPLGLLGQIEGGVIMGLGHALTEEFIVEEGMVITDRLARYRMPSIKHTPEIIPIVVEHPVSGGPHGAKGVGELSLIPTPPAITNAVYNACGIRLKRIPIDQDWLARQIAARSNQS